jgi:hypothetical protein
VTDTTHPAGQVIGISGQGWNGSAITDGNGNYTVTIPVTKLGTVTAMTMDNQSNRPQVALNPPAPQIVNFVASAEPGGLEDFSGKVTGTPNPGGMSIAFGGLTALLNRYTQVNADGTFDVVFALNGQVGVAMAQTKDWWGQVSNVAQDYVS